MLAGLGRRRGRPGPRRVGLGRAGSQGAESRGKAASLRPGFPRSLLSGVVVGAARGSWPRAAGLCERRLQRCFRLWRGGGRWGRYLGVSSAPTSWQGEARRPVPGLQCHIVMCSSGLLLQLLSFVFLSRDQPRRWTRRLRK